MYQKEIPSELRADIKLVVQRNSGLIKFKEQDLRYLMTVYYRYIGKLDDSTEDLEASKALEMTVNKNLTCGNCIGQVQHYFKTKSLEW